MRPAIRRCAETSWDDYYRDCVHPRVATALLREAVPALAAIGWSVVETAEGYARTVLPLDRASTNQHGTHQAALIVLAADYTGGVALATVARAPVLGVHPQRADDDGAALWLAGVRIRYLAPSTSDLTLRAHIAPERQQSIRERYAAGAPCVERVSIRIESDGEQVARAVLTYYLAPSRSLRPQRPGAKISLLFQHRLKASARLIAALRAAESASPDPLFHDAYSARIAGEHGRLLAQRHLEVLPQLKPMVAARTRHADDLIAREIARGARQVVFVGVGLDVRVLRSFGDVPAVRVFELDLPPMLAERERMLAAVAGRPPVPRTAVPVDLELEDVADRLLCCAEFDASLPTVFVYEGMSMYFDDAVNARFLRSVRRLLETPGSVLWLDVVARSVIDGTSGFEEADAFLEGMERLGEPFVFGLDDAPRFFAQHGLRVVEDVSSGAFRKGAPDPVFDLYRFYVLSGGGRCEEGGRGAPAA